ncbi:MAG: cadherin domain-containing protein [Roseibium sp.]|uniref:beta strand repeat-containing protein n=1 Tax=Roseibium sp. TaxID=1936156 RepID=UPI002624C19B|nr:cadherin domain-containing protein [Roseibium sp.]MCV0425225.1 cadherin domain-containing protein [Roseibium sp.]
MASDTENQGQQKTAPSDGGNSGSQTTLTSDSYLQSALLDTRDNHLDKVHDYHLQQDKGVSSEQVNANLHLHSAQNQRLPGEEPTPASTVPDKDTTNQAPAPHQSAEQNQSETQVRQPEPIPTDDGLQAAAPISEAALGDVATVNVFSQLVANPDKETGSTQPIGNENSRSEVDQVAGSARATQPAEERITLSEPAASGLSALSDVDDLENSVAEDAAVGAVTGIQASAVVTVDALVQYSLLDDANGLFAINPESGIVTVAGELDAESAGTHSIVVLATASDGETQIETFTITIQDFDEYDVSSIEETGTPVDQIREDVTAGETGIAVSAEDLDVSDTVIYTIDDSRFEIDGDGVVSIAADAIFDAETESSVSFTVTATSTDGSETSQLYSLRISDVSEFAATDVTDTDASANNIAEDAVSGTQVGITALATDADISDSVTYSVSDDRFEVAADGTVTVASGAKFDAETESSIDVVVAATSTDGSSSQETFSISVSDVNETPVTDVYDTDDSDNTIAEHTAAGTQTGITAFATDADTSDSVTYSVADDRFEVADDGTVTVASGAKFDAETESSIDVVVTATSSDGSTSQEAFTITVSDINENAISAVSDSDVSVNTIAEDAVAGTKVGITAFASDTDASDSVTYSVSDDRFEISDAGTVTVASGALFDAETESEIDVTVTATSTDGSVSQETFSLEVSDISDNAPTDIQLSGQSGNLIQNGSFEAFDLSSGSWTQVASDPTNAWSSSGSIEVWDTFDGVHATDGDQHLELDSGNNVNSISQSVETTNGQVYDLSMDIRARSSSATSTVEIYWNGDLVSSFDPEMGNWNSYDFQVVGTGSDDVLEIREASEDNDSYGALLDNVSLTEVPMTISENVSGAVVGTITTSDADDTDSHAYSVSDQRFEIIRDSDGNALLKLKDTETLDRENEDSVTLTITTTDEAGLNYSEDFVISVADVSETEVSEVSDQDASTNSIAENAAAGTQIGITALATDEDATDGVTYSVSDDRFSVADDGSIIVASGARFDAETEEAIDIVITATSTDGSSSQETFTIAVSDVNERAVSNVSDTDASDNSVSENAAVGTRIGITALATDADASDSVTYSVSDDRFSVDASGVVTVGSEASFDLEAENSISLIVTATSTDGTTSSQTFSVSVADIAENLQLADGGVTFTDEARAELSVTGGSGDDTITAHEDGGNLSGGDGADWLIGGIGDDTLAGSEGADLLQGGAGDDTMILAGETSWSGYYARNVETGDLVSLTGKTRNSDVFHGGDGTDTLRGTDQADAVFLDDGFSKMHSEASGARLDSIETVELGAGNDLLDMTSSTYTYSTDMSVDGGTGDDVIWTADGNDTLSGGEGNDTLFGGAGDDTLDGGADADTAVYSGNFADYDIVENDDGSFTITDTRASGPDGTDIVSNVESFSFADGDKLAIELVDTSVGPVSDNDASTNTIHETDVAGTQVGITATATDPDGEAVSYSLNDDRFDIDADGVVTIADHAFFDSQVESSVDLTITAASADGSESSETFSITVSGDYDYEFTGGTGNGTFSGSGQSISVDGVGGGDNISTGDYGDRIEGGSIAGADMISGNGGRDLLFGEGGQDMISGGAGDDVIIGGADGDNLVGGDGSDLFMYGLGDGNDTISGGAGAAWTDVLDLGGGPGVSAAGDFGTDWTITITEGSIETTDLENGKLDLTEDASGTIEFLDGSKIDFTEMEEIRWG